MKVETQFEIEEGHEELVNLFEESFEDIDQPILDLYEQESKHDERVVFILLSDEIPTVYNQFLQKVRELGYEVVSFGKNRTHFGNPTFGFKVVENNAE